MSKKIIIIALAILFIIRMLGSCSDTSTIVEEKIDNFVDVSSIEVVTGDYNITSLPIGIGEYTIGEVSDKAEFSIEVLKNTNSPWCGAVTIEWDLFDSEGKAIGKTVGKSTSLQMGKEGRVTVSFKINESGKITYNQREIKKIVLSSVREDDDLHRFLGNIFYSKKTALKRYLEDGNLEMFYTELENIRQEYNRDEFPNQNRELDELEIEAKKLGGTNSEDVQVTSSSKKENVKSSTMVKYKKYLPGSKLSKGDKIFIAGKIDNLKITRDRIYVCIDNAWYDIRSNIGFYCKDVIFKNGGIEDGCRIGIAAEFIEYWETSDNVQFVALNASWFTPASFMDTESEYIEFPIYDGRDIYSEEVTI